MFSFMPESPIRSRSVQAGAQMLGISGLEHVETGRRYILDSRLSEDDVHSIAQALLYNPVIQEYILYPTGSNRQPANAQSSPTSDLYPKGHRSPSVGGAAIMMPVPPRPMIAPILRMPMQSHVLFLSRT